MFYHNMLKIIILQYANDLCYYTGLLESKMYVEVQEMFQRFLGDFKEEEVTCRSAGCWKTVWPSVNTTKVDCDTEIISVSSTGKAASAPLLGSDVCIKGPPK